MKLEDIHKDNVFKVPDQYFEDFPDRLKQRISKEEETSTSSSARIISIRTVIRLAAAAVVLIFVVYGVKQFWGPQETAEQMLSGISTDALIEYLVESDLSTEELLENMDVSVIAFNEGSLPETLIPAEAIDEETIEELLDEYEIEMQYL